jgi:hypothetical protein
LMPVARLKPGVTLAQAHPTYPRKIVPPIQRPAPSAPSDTLSRNSGPALAPSKLKYDHN